MKKADPSSEVGLRPEYRREDLGKGVRGKYYKAYSEGTNLILLSPDVAAVFPTADAVNEALRSLVKIAQASTRRTRRSKGAVTAAPSRGA
ncbi:MAG TPA: hypothetical protein VGG20_07910 [Thermoanaerobaculia bacterium]